MYFRASHARANVDGGALPIINPIIGETVPGDVTSILRRPFPLVYRITITAVYTTTAFAHPIDISFLSFAPTPLRQLTNTPARRGLPLVSHLRHPRLRAAPRVFSFVVENSANIRLEDITDVVYGIHPLRYTSSVLLIVSRIFSSELRY